MCGVKQGGSQDKHVRFLVFGFMDAMVLLTWLIHYHCSALNMGLFDSCYEAPVSSFYHKFQHKSLT
ncbi:hypothetical protein BCR42DRAFT_420348 [Absidia repens]|uniref:Uncharacterized protein n=1 Tax=Absidia repens TaxID=90262 RepID=A0A1X2I9R3_9FUNG|nr:hypothetical protein BCR42DRAFT_420348 [Absidia repens]